MKRGFTLIELLIVVAIIAILAAIAVPNFLEAQTRSRVARVQADQRTIAVAIESYYVDCSSYPAQASSFPSQASYGVNDIQSCPTALTASCRYMPTFIHKRDQNDNTYTLTTPMSYMTSFVADPFASSKGATYSYSVGGSYGQGWIMWSYGPDMDEYQSGMSDIQIVQGAVRGQPAVDTLYYNPGVQTTMLLINATYDATNGTSSSGDVYKIKQ